jgi:hypothetical protein
MKLLSIPSLLVTLAAAATAVAQSPEVLIPSGSTDGTFRLVDRNNDGDYADPGEVYDYVLDGVDTSNRNTVIVPGSPARLYWCSAVTEQILWAEDTDANGIIDASTEIRVFYDLVGTGTTHEINFMDIDSAGRLWWTNNAGTVEGLYRSVDSNADGDAEDAGETVAVLLESTRLTIANAPITGAPTVSVTALDSVTFDPTWGPNGRLLLEEEDADFTMALEDLNNDGDFVDAGEAYIFSALYNAGILGLDVNPDVPGILPRSNESFVVKVDASGATPVYYIVTGSACETGCLSLVYRGIDNNTDGDINDAGEVRVFWDGSLDSTGAVPEYNFNVGIEVWNGKVYVNAEWDGVADEEHLFRLDDNNNDGDANDAGELVVLWRLPADTTHYNPTVFPAGVLAPAPAGNPGTYLYYGGATCASSLPGSHNVQIGSDNWNDKPTIGNAGFILRTWGAAPTAPGLYAIGLAAISIPLDPPANTCVLLQTLEFLLPLLTDATGATNDPTPIPLDPALIGGEIYVQSLVIDNSQTFGFTVSDGAWVRIGAQNYSYSVH